MGSYPVFSAPGPTVDVRLFGDAAETGAKLGQQIPSPVTSAITGAEAGIKYGQDFTKEQAQIADEQAVARLHKVAADNAEATQQLQVADTTAKLESDTYKNQTALTDAREQDALEQKWGTLDPLAQKQLYFSGSIDSQLAKNPDFAKQALKSIGPYLNESERQAAAYSMGKFTINAQQDRLAAANLKAATIAQETLLADEAYGQAVKDSGLSQELALNRLHAAPSGYYNYDPGTKNILFDDKTRKVSTNPIDTAHPPASYALVQYDENNNPIRVLREGIPTATHNLMGKAAGLRGYIDGSYKANANSEYDRAVEQHKAAQQGNTPAYGVSTFSDNTVASTPKEPAKETLGQTGDSVKPNFSYAQNIRNVPVLKSDGTISLSDNNKAYLVAKGTLGLPDKDFTDIKPKLNNIFQVLEASPGGEFGKPDAQQTQEILNSKKSIASFTAGKEWDTHPEIQKQTSEQAVTQHNAHVDDFNEAMSNPYADGMQAFFSMGAQFGGENINQMIKVGNPRDLYILRKGDFYNQLLDTMIGQYRDQIIQSKKALLRRGSVSGNLIASQ